MEANGNVLLINLGQLPTSSGQLPWNWISIWKRHLSENWIISDRDDVSMFQWTRTSKRRRRYVNYEHDPVACPYSWVLMGLGEIKGHFKQINLLQRKDDRDAETQEKENISNEITLRLRTTWRSAINWAQTLITSNMESIKWGWYRWEEGMDLGSNKYKLFCNLIEGQLVN